jgi:Asp-tRNA(Asn)/Glu-tRNA(Gln) amidotransferase A subunit family amidase
VFALKPSFGRVPIYPPYLGRVVGPMTRSVADAALLMEILTNPDARDFMALPYQAIDWSRALIGAFLPIASRAPTASTNCEGRVTPARPTAWLGISDSNFDVQREYSSL